MSSLAVSGNTPEISAALGAKVSTINGNGADVGLVLPAGSVAVVVIECGPSTNAVGGVNVHVPSG